MWARSRALKGFLHKWDKQTHTGTNTNTYLPTCLQAYEAKPSSSHTHGCSSQLSIINWTEDFLDGNILGRWHGDRFWRETFIGLNGRAVIINNSQPLAKRSISNKHSSTWFQDWFCYNNIMTSGTRQCQVRVRFESGVKKKFLAALNQLPTSFFQCHNIPWSHSFPKGMTCTI